MKVCVTGLGYVGLTLALTLSDCGIRIFGMDYNKNTINLLKNGIPTLSEKGIDVLLKKHLGKNFSVSEEIMKEDYDAFIICVGTPLKNDNSPLMEHIVEASKQVGSNLKKRQLVVVRSTVPVGTTRNVVIPILEKKSGLMGEKDFDVVFAPERTAEGVALSELRTNPQIIGGLSEDGVNRAAKLFSIMANTIVSVSSLEAAEMIKLIDNTYRDVHFAYSNEIALICEMLKLDARECITKANLQYSRNNIPTPSPGVGGPCLSKDSYILTHVANQFGYKPNLIMHSRWINEFVPTHLAAKIIKKMKIVGKGNNSKIFVIGFAFKGNPETGDYRESSTLILLSELKKHFSMIYGYDPVITEQELQNIGVLPTTVEKGFERADCVIIMNNHKSYLDFDMNKLVETTSKPLIFADCWGMFGHLSKEKQVIYTSIGIE